MSSHLAEWRNFRGNSSDLVFILCSCVSVVGTQICMGRSLLGWLKIGSFRYACPNLDRTKNRTSITLLGTKQAYTLERWRNDLETEEMLNNGVGF